MSLNLAVMVVENACRFPERTALVCEDRTLSYGQLDAQTNRLANVLTGLGLRPGDKVVLMLPNIIEFAVAYHGILKAGGVVVPINILYKSREIEFLLADSEAVAFIGCTEYLGEALAAFHEVPTCRDLLVVPYPAPSQATSHDCVHCYQELLDAASPEFDLAPTGPEDTAVIGYTSGTTGKPKGAELTHFNLFFQSRVLPELTDEPRLPDDVRMAVLPLFHCYGQSCVMNTAIGLGCTMSLLPRYDPGKMLAAIQRDRVTHFAAVPTMYVQLLSHPERCAFDLSTLRSCGSGGAPLPIEVGQAWRREYQLDIHEGYGLTETSPTATYSQGSIKPKTGSCGKPVWGCQVKIVDDNGHALPVGGEGEVLIRGVNVMKGYYKKPEETAAALKDGWLYTGDIGKLDDEGYLYIVGRKKDMILRGGLNIYPREIEELLYEHPAVEECAVIGVPHAELGEEVKAIVFPKMGKTLTVDEVRGYCKERIAAFKYPRIVEIRTEPLPKGPSGKILKRELVAQHESGSK